MTNYFPSNHLAFVAAAVLCGGVEATRIGDYDYELRPAEAAIELWSKFTKDELVFSARLLSDQIRELRKAPIVNGGQP